jgi:hypothetical protein
VTGRLAVVRAVLGTARHGDAIVVTGRYARDPDMRNTWVPDPPALCCDYLATELAGDGAGRCDIADVIISRACLRRPVDRAQLASVLSRYPGCAVVAGAGPGACLVADRHGSVMSIAVVGRECPPGLCVLACGSFVHGWMCAGWPLAALNPQLRVAASRGRAGWDGLAQGVIVSCSLAVAGPVPTP